jgi:WD40 repeat protein
VASGKQLAQADLAAAKGELAWGVAVLGDVVITSTDKDRIALWSAATLSPGSTPAVVKDRLSDLSFVGDALLVADSNRVGLLDVHTGKLAAETQHSIATGSSIGPASIAVGSTQADVALFDRTTLAPISSWRTNDDIVTIVRFRPDGKIVATSGGNSVRLWDPATGNLLAERSDLPTYVTRLEWSPDGTHLAFGGLAPMVWLWDVSPAEPARSCALTMALADAALVIAPAQTTWCAPTSR